MTDPELAEALAPMWRATIELSNQCQLAHVHKRCPAHDATEVQILPWRIITGIFEGLASIQFKEKRKATLAYHCYNEPCIDPRLYDILETAQCRFPGVAQHIWTNGIYMSRDLFLELCYAGANRWTFSGYTKQRHDELIEMTRAAPRGVTVKVGEAYKHKLDGRNSTWADEVKDRTRPCMAPLGDLMHRASGNVTLCCYDCKESVVFGNLHEQSWRDIILGNRERMTHIHNTLMQGKRNAPGMPEACRHCRLGR